MSSTPPKSDGRFAVIVASLAAFSMWFGYWHIQTAPPLLYAAWAMAAYLGLPLAAVVFLDSRGLVPRTLAVLGGAVAWLPLAWGAWATGADATLAARPLMVLVPATLSALMAVLLSGSVGVDLGRWGAGAGDWKWWGPRTAGLVILTIGLVVLWVALDPAMRAHHPFYEPARTDVRELWGLVLCMGLYMVAWEFFFRGFLLFGVARTAGPVHAVLFQALPFYLMHRVSPESEFVMSFVGGALLAVFCWRARSFWPAFVLHWVLNASVQVVCFYWPS